jgi:ERCC4-type nuclease
MKLGKARTFKSTLDDVPGIGPKTRKALLTAFCSVDAIRAASDEALLAVPGVNRKQIQALRDHWVDPDGESVAGEEFDSDCTPGDANALELETRVGASLEN